MTNDTVRTLLVAAGRLENAQLVDAEGEELGQLEEVLIHTGGGRIAYIVVSFGNLFDQGSRHFAVPWNVLTVDTAEQRIVLDVDRERLENAPRFVKDGWSNRVDDAWMTDLFRHYGLQYEPNTTGRQVGGSR